MLDDALKSLNNLKHTMTQTPVLALLILQKNFVFQMDASGYGMGVVLLQEGQPIFYFSKNFAFCPELQNSSTYVRYNIRSPKMASLLGKII